MIHSIWSDPRTQGCTRSVTLVRSVSQGFGYLGVGLDFIFLYAFGPNRVQVGDCEAVAASVTRRTDPCSPEVLQKSPGRS